MADPSTKIVITAEDRASAALKGISSGLTGLADSAARSTLAMSGIGAALSGAGLAAMAKTAIDAGDALNDLSQRTGIGVAALAKYELAAKQSGASLESIARGIKGLATNMAEHGKALAAAGITAKDADGALRQLADVFAKMPDGMEKAALATKLFGKAGMDLIPMLNMGSRGLDEAAEKSARYAAAMALLAPQADRFNDTLAELGMNSRIVGLTLADKLLPHITDIAGAMAEAARESGVLMAAWVGLGGVADAVLGKPRRGLVDINRDINQVSESIGKLNKEDALHVQKLAALNDQLARLAAERDKITAPKASTKPKELDLDAWKKQYQALWDAMKEGSGKAGKDSAKAYVDEFARLMERLDAKDAGLDTSFWKDLTTLHAAYQSGRVDIEAYRGAVEKLVTQQKFHQDALSASAKAEKEWADASNRAAETARRSLDTLQEKARAAEEELDNYGRTRSEIEDTIIARLEEQRAIAASTDSEAALVESLDAEIEARQRLRDASRGLEAQEASRKAIEDQAKAWENFSRDIEQSLTDALMRGFESGEGFGENFVKTLQNTLKTAALKIAVQMVVQPVMGSLGQALGYTQGGAGGGGLGGMSNIFSPISNIATSSIGGSAFGAGMLSGVSESLLGASFVGPSASLAGNASIAAGASFGSFLPAIGIGLGLLSLFGGDLFGGKEKPPVAAWTQFPQGSKDWGIPLATPWGDLRFAGQHMGDTEAEVAKLRDAFAPIAQRDYAISGLLTGEENKRIEQSIAGYTTGEMEDYSEAAMRAHFEKRLALVSDAIGGWVDEIADAFSGSLEDSYSAIATLLSVRGIDGAEELARAFIGTFETAAGEAIVQAQSGTFMDSYINNLNAGGGDTVISSLSRDGESLADTFTRLVSDLVVVRDAFDLMGRAALDFSLAAADMASSIIEAAGGAEAFQGKFAAYYAEFYTEQERLAKHTERTAAEFDKLGLAMPASHEAFRALVDGIDLTSAAGQELFASLLNLAPAFDIVADAAEAAAAKHAASMRDLSIQWAEAYGRPDWAKEMRRQDVRASITDQDQLDLQNAVWRRQDMAAKRELEIQLMEAQGNDSGATAARRALEIEGTDEALRGLKLQIWAAQDARVAAEEAARAQAEAAEAARRAAEEQARAQKELRDGWQRVADSIWETMRRLRGDILDPSQNFARAQSDFAISTAAARAGDQDAAGRLPTLAQAVVELGKSQASTAVEQALLTARTLASLDRTVKGLAQTFGLDVPAYAAGSAFIPRDTLALVHEGERIIPAADNRALIAAMSGDSGMASELRALRAEVALLRQSNSAENSAIANHAKTAADVLDTSARGGRSLYTRTTA